MEPTLLYFEPRPLLRERGQLLAAVSRGDVTREQQRKANDLFDQVRVAIPLRNANRFTPFLSRVEAVFAQAKATSHGKYLEQFLSKCVQNLPQVDFSWPDFLARDDERSGRVILNSESELHQKQVPVFGNKKLQSLHTTAYCNGALAWSAPQTVAFDIAANCFVSYGEKTQIPTLVFGYAEVKDRIGATISYSDQSSRDFARDTLHSFTEVVDEFVAARGTSAAQDFGVEMIKALREPWPLHLQQSLDKIYNTDEASQSALCNVSFTSWGKRNCTMLNCGAHFVYLLDSEGLRLLFGDTSGDTTPYDRRSTITAKSDKKSFPLEEIAESILLFSNFDISKVLDQTTARRKFATYTQAALFAENLRELFESRELTNKLFTVVKLNSQGRIE